MKPFISSILITLGSALLGSAAWADDAKPAAEPPPLPFLTIEGVGGGAFTPVAYLVNPGPKDQAFGLPSVGVDYINLGQKDLEALLVSETLYGRVELSYAVDRLGLGKLPDDIKSATGSASATTIRRRLKAMSSTFRRTGWL